MEVINLEVEGDQSTMKACRNGNRCEACRNGNRCETRVLGIQWPQWHTSMFEEQVPVDMRSWKSVKMVCWKKWTAKYECEELKEGVWQEPIQSAKENPLSVDG